MNKMVNDLNYEGINIPVSKKDYIKIEEKISICIRVFSYENDLACPANISEQPFEDQMDLLLITHENNYIMTISKDSINLCTIRQRTKIKSTFADIVYKVLVAKEF